MRVFKFPSPYACIIAFTKPMDRDPFGEIKSLKSMEICEVCRIFIIYSGIGRMVVKCLVSIGVITPAGTADVFPNSAQSKVRDDSRSQRSLLIHVIYLYVKLINTK